MDSPFDSAGESNLIELLNKNNINDNFTDNSNVINPLQLMKISNKYYDTDKISGELHKPNMNYKLKVIHYNIHSLPDKFDQLKLFLTNSQIDPDIILLCETFLNERNQLLYELEDYQFISTNRKTKSCGGVGMYIKSGITFKLRPDLAPHIEGIFESIFIEILNPDLRYIVGEIYRPPNTNVQNAIDNYEATINMINQSKLQAIIGTDQNLCYMRINEHKKTQDLLNTFFENGYIPTIIKPTRITQNTATLIDNIYIKASKNTNITSGIITTDISDHLPILMCIQSSNSSKNTKQILQTRSLNDEKINKIREEIGKQNWYYLSQMETNEAHIKFNDEINSIIDKIAPEKTIKLNRKKTAREKWMTKGLLKSSLTKEKLYKKAIKKEKSHSLYCKYIKFRNKFNIIKRLIKARYYSDELEENKHDIKATWKIMKAAMNKLNNKSNTPHIIKHKGNTITEQKTIVNAFCDYFTNVGQEYANNIPKTNKLPKMYMKNKQMNTMYLNPTDPEEISNIINRLKPKNSSGHDNINSKLLKSLVSEIKLPVSILTNLSLSNGIFPDIYKLAEVVPIFKAKNKEEVTNYRPISLLPTLSKILEKVIHKRTYSYLQKNKILYNSQYGFRPKHSTNDAITELITDITENLEDKTNTITTFLDLSKAFDTIDHNILLNKLEHYGLRGKSQKWFKSYLTNRKQYVKINNHKSNTQNVSCGVPQGSVLGPLLFIIYTNDLPNSLTDSHAILFADDTTVYATSKTLDTLYHKTNKDLKSLDEWFKTNKLSLNIDKTNYMLFTNDKKTRTDITNYKIMIGDKEISQKTDVKFLGITIDEHLNWKKHITNTKNKISKTFYILKMVKNILPQKNLKTLYDTIIKPYLDYGIIFWGGTHESHLKNLIIMQKKLSDVSQALPTMNIPIPFSRT